MPFQVNRLLDLLLKEILSIGCVDVRSESPRHRLKFIFRIFCQHKDLSNLALFIPI